MTQPQGLEQVDPSAVGFAQRAQTVMDIHPYLDHPTVVALADQTSSPSQAEQAAQTVAHAISQAWDGYEQTWSDPTLQAKPSVESGLVQYIHDTIGPPPIDAGTISQLQSSLQADGLGKNLSVDGAWTSDWQQAYNQALEATRAQQLAGEKPGSVQTSTALHGFLSHITATGALDAIVGWFKDVPDLARTVAGYTGGAVAGLGHVITHPSEIVGNSRAEKETIASANRSIQNALGGHMTQQTALHQEGIAGGLNALNAALTFTGVAGFGKKALEDVAATAAKDAAESVVRKPGVIAKTLFNGNQNGRLLGSKWVGNLPGIARVTPMVGKLAGADGYYYRARTFLAQPYKNAAIQAAGQAFSRTQLLGLGLYGDALATSKIPGNTESKSILGTHTLDAIDHNITQYGPRIFGWSPLDINNLALFLHGPAGMSTEGSASNAVGQYVKQFTNRFTDTLGAKGVPAAFQQATGLSRADYLKMAGGDSRFLAAYMTSKVLGYAQDWYADRKLGEQLSGADANQIDQLTQFKKDFRALPNEQKAQVVSDMLTSDPSMAYLTNRIRGDIARSVTDPKAAARASLADFKTKYEAFQQLHAAGDLQYLMTPKTGALLAEERAFHNAANLPADFGSARYVRELNPNLDQDLGLARNDTLTREDVLNPGGIADQFAKQIDAAEGNPLLIQQVSDRMAQHLWENHNWDARKLGVFGATGNPQRLLEAIKSEAEGLASEPYATGDMPEATAQRIQALRDQGYKIVVGDHLGDFYIGNMPDVGADQGWLTLARKWAGKAGLDPTKVPDQEVGRATRQGIMDELAHLIANDPRLDGKLGPYVTPSTIVAMLSEEGGVQKSLPWYARGIFHAAAKVGLNKTEIEHMFQSGAAESVEHARAEMEQRLASGLGPRDTSRKAIVDALLHPHTVRTDSGATWEWPGIPGALDGKELLTATDEQAAAHAEAVKTANLIVRAIDRGYRQPGYIMGWQAIENWARAGYGIGDWVATRYPGSDLLQNVANWPNRVAQVRNRLRFTVSAEFDIRRWVKQSAKMAAEGVEPVANPLQRLLDEGSALASAKALSKVTGSTQFEDQMNLDRMLAGRSIFGLYSPQWHGAYFANELAKQGKSVGEIKQAFDRVFKYGSEGGVSPLERSANTVFFPFSFEKTLLRNFGSYLLDRPAQALALDLAVDEWRKWDKNSQVGKFVEDHFPILWEMNTLNNAFTHGISPGQLGGINAPIIGGVGGVIKNANKAITQPTDGQKSAALLNLFMPQNWGSGFTAKNLQRYLPVWGQFQKVLAAANDQAQIATNALYDVAAHAAGSTVIRPTLTTLAQQQYGTREKVKLIDQMQAVLAYNAQQADDASKVKWQAAPYVPNSLIGQPITRTTIGEYVQQMYPHYDPNSGTAYAQQQQRAEAAFIANITAKDPTKGQQMYTFAHLANSVIGKINRDEYEPARLAQVQDAFHQFARAQGSLDPEWQRLYTSFFAYALGPIKSPTGKAAA